MFIYKNPNQRFLIRITSSPIPSTHFPFAFIPQVMEQWKALEAGAQTKVKQQSFYSLIESIVGTPTSSPVQGQGGQSLGEVQTAVDWAVSRRQRMEAGLRRRTRSRAASWKGGREDERSRRRMKTHHRAGAPGSHAWSCPGPAVRRSGGLCGASAMSAQGEGERVEAGQSTGLGGGVGDRKRRQARRYYTDGYAC